MRNKNDNVEKIRAHRKTNADSDSVFVLPTTMLVTFKTIEQATEWIKEDTELRIEASQPRAKQCTATWVMIYVPHAA